MEKAQRSTVDARLQWLLQYFYGIFNTMETETGIHVAMTQHTNNSAVFDISSFFSFLPRLAATSSSRGSLFKQGTLVKQGQLQLKKTTLFKRGSLFKQGALFKQGQ